MNEMSIERLFGRIKEQEAAFESIPRVPAIQGSGGGVRRFIVVTENTDDLDCHFYDADTVEEGDFVVKVAKPKVLRGAVTGLYAAGDEILAVHNIAGGTGVSGVDFEALTTPPYWTADPVA